MALFKRKSDPVRSDDDEPLDPEARSPETGLKYKDILALATMKRNGIDLHEPRDVRFFLYFAEESKASRAAEVAAAIQFTPDLVLPTAKADGTWSLVLERKGMVLHLDTLRDHDAFLTNLTTDFDGTYDGWEASA